MELKVAIGNPRIDGMYVAYVEGIIEPYTKRELLMWVYGVWSYPGSDQKYRGTIYGWIGPLPTPRVSDLVKTYYAIGSKKEGQWAFTDGPIDDIQELLEGGGAKGDYIVQLVEYANSHIKEYRWNHKTSSWRKL